MASVFKHRDKWRAEIRIDGKRYTKSFDLKRDADRWVLTAYQAIEADKTPTTSYRVKDLFERYMDEVTIEKASQKSETLRINRFLKSFPNLKLQDVNKEAVNTWIVNREKEVSAATVIRELNTIKNAFKVANERWGWINHNPFMGSKTIRKPPARDRILTWSEIKELLKTFKYPLKSFDNMIKTQEVGVALMVGLRTGLRLGEILQLGKDNVDLKKGIVTIAQHKTVHKTGKPRVVPISNKTVRILAKFPNRARFFTVEKGSFDAIFRRKRDKLKINNLHFHDTRATALTMLSKYLDAMDLAKVSGHRDLNILLNTYYREKPEDISAKMNRKIK